MSPAEPGPADTSDSADRSSLVVCIAEDRRSYECALRLLIASLIRHCPGLPIQLFAPDPSPPFREWLRARPEVTLNTRPIEGGLGGYDVKPQALIGLIERGFEQVLWIDSDVLVLSDFRPALDAIGPITFVTTEEALCSSHPDPDALRARLWGFAVGRTLPFTANSGVIRASKAHLGLLRRWLALLGEPSYRAAQKRPWHERPLHLMGDQEVLTAVLASAEFADVPIKFIRRGSGIIQYFGSTGYTVRERLRHLFYREPFFFHSQGYKPWWQPMAGRGHSFSDRFNSLYQEVTPYVILARPYSVDLESDDWLEPRSAVGRVLRRLAFGQAPLFGLPLAILADAVRAAKNTGRSVAAVLSAFKPDAPAARPADR
jgi:hypothetical protein